MRAPILRIPGSARYHRHPVCSQNATNCKSCNLAIFWHVAHWRFYTSSVGSLSSRGAHPHEKSDVIFRCMTSLMNKKHNVSLSGEPRGVWISGDARASIRQISGSLELLWHPVWSQNATNWKSSDSNILGFVLSSKILTLRSAESSQRSTHFWKLI